MGTVYKKTFTKPLPAGAKIIVRKGQQLAEWIDAKGETPDGTAYRRRGSSCRGGRHLYGQVPRWLGDRAGSGDPTAEEPSYGDQDRPHPDCERCGMPAKVEVEGTPMCRGCYGEIMSP
jgi:hypothetical protein